MVFLPTLQATASASSTAEATVPDTLHAISSTTFEVTFEVTGPVDFALSGLLAAEASDSFIFGASAGASILLTDGVTNLFAHDVEPGPDGQFQDLTVDESGRLDTGTYTLRATVVAIIDTDVPPNRAGVASLTMRFDLSDPSCLPDVNLDGLVDVADLVAVLLAFGSTDTGADVNHDGQVDVQDLVDLLLAWGPGP